MPSIKEESSITIEVRVQPKSSRDEIVGFEGGRIKVRVTAPPEGGKANERLREVIANALKVSKSKVEIVKGEKSRLKVLRVLGVSQDTINFFMRNFTDH